MRPDITIVICVKDAADTLHHSLDSLLHQTVGAEAFSVVVVNDGSTDASSRVIASYADQFKRFEYIDRAENRGVNYSMNEGICQVATPWYMRLDPDDELHEKAVEIFTARLGNAYDLIVAHRIHAYPDKDKLVQVTRSIFSWIGCGVLIDTAKARSIGFYRDLLWEEFDFYIRYLQKGYGRVGIIDTPLYKYRIVEGSITSSPEERARGFEELVKLHRLEILQKFGYEGRDYLR